MHQQFTTGDLKIELSAIGSSFAPAIDIPLVAYDYIVDRLMQSTFIDRKDENYVNILIFHTLSRTVEHDKSNSEEKNKLYDVAVAMTLRLMHIGILLELGREKPLPPGLDPHNPVTSSNTILYTNTLKLTLPPHKISL